MALKAELCEAWVEAQAAPGERYLTYVVTSTNAPTNPAPVGSRTGMTFSGAEAVRDLVRRLGLNDADKVGWGVSSTFLALSDRRVLYGSRSSFRDRPKDLLHEAPASGFAMYWVDDDTGAGNRFRHLLLDFGEGAWRTDRIGLTALGKDMSHRTNLHEFFEVLGDRAHPITT
jgi:hypothetical protein